MSLLKLPTALLAAVLVTLSSAGELKLEPKRSPEYQHAFQSLLPIPEVKKPLATYTNPETGVPIDFYQIEAKSFERKLFPNLRAARLFGYDGSFPGPTFRVDRGRETVVRVVNRGKESTNMHLHGSYSRSPWDGWADDLIAPNEYKDYYFPNSISARTLWYHDHANRHNAMNMYRGLAGMYQIVDQKQDAELGLPTDPKFDIPLVFSAHYFTAQGDLTDESKERNSIYGDTMLVNGAIQPYLAVEPRKYRFRILNAAVSRSFNFSLQADTTSPVTMTVIGSDGGLRPGPAATTSLITGMAERWEVIVDFASFAGKNLTLRTANVWTDTRYADSYPLLQFRVGDSANGTVKSAPLPKKFNVGIKIPVVGPEVPAKEFSLVSHMDMMWGINSYHMDDPMKRILMRPPLGTTEKYIFRSSGMSMGGGMMGSQSTGSSTPSSSNSSPMAGMMSGMSMTGSHSSSPSSTSSSGTAGHHGHNKRQSHHSGSTQWVHAMHLHLVDMQALSRSRSDPSLPGRAGLEPYEIGSIKDTITLGANEAVTVAAQFQPYAGVYMWHCHNAVHEDNGMMAVLNITALSADYGYGAADVGLEDPLDARFRARRYEGGTDLERVRSEVLPAFARLNAYPDPRKVAEALEKYWTGRAAPDKESTGEKVAKGKDPWALDVHNSHHGTVSSGSTPAMTAASSAGVMGGHAMGGHATGGSQVSETSSPAAGRHGNSGPTGDMMSSSSASGSGMMSGGHGHHGGRRKLKA